MTQRAEITTDESTLIYANRWLRLREDRITRADGSQGHYSIVEKRDFAVIAALGDNTLTLVEQYRYPVKGRYWEFPQGSWESDDVAPLTLAHAELREETGLTAGSMIHAGRLFPAYGCSPQSYDIFLATDLTPGTPDLDPEEVGLIARAFPIHEVEAMILDGVIRDATTVAAFGLLRLKGLF